MEDLKPYAIYFDESDPKSRSRTLQAPKEETDINLIMKRANSTGYIGDPLKQTFRQAQYGDFSEMKDFHTSLNKVQQLQTDFMKLPASLRKKFNNDVTNLTIYLSDPKNLKEAVELGLLPKEALPKPEMKPTSQEIIDNNLETTDPAPEVTG